MKAQRRETPFRNITYGMIEWRGITIAVTLEKQAFVDHLAIETLEPLRAPLPITETGYRSHFVTKDSVELSGGPEEYVTAWLDSAARGQRWADQEAAIRQYALL
jgi:hypothetical protein